jgi:hypothetical protein
VFAPDFLNTWELSKAVDFKFPTGVTIPANGYALIVNFDPSNATQRAAFISKYAVPTNTPIFGPYGGKLDNSAGSIKLSRPDAQGTNGNVPYIEVDQWITPTLRPGRRERTASVSRSIASLTRIWQRSD